MSDPNPADTCGPCHSGRHARCYAPCLCADREHLPLDPTRVEVPGLRALLVDMVRDGATSWTADELRAAHELFEHALSRLPVTTPGTLADGSPGPTFQP